MRKLAKMRHCPFCRASDAFVECADFGSFYVMCNRCGARGPDAEGDGCDPDAENRRGARNAINAWNRRPSKAALATPSAGAQDSASEDK